MMVNLQPGDLYCTLSRAPDNKQKEVLVLALRLMMAANAMRSLRRIIIPSSDAIAFRYEEDGIYSLMSMFSMAAEASRIIAKSIKNKTITEPANWERRRDRQTFEDCMKGDSDPLIERLLRVRDKMHAHHDRDIAMKWVETMVTQKGAFDRFPLYAVTPGEYQGARQRFPWAWWAYMASLAEGDDVQSIEDLKLLLKKMWKLSLHIMLLTETLVATMLAPLPLQVRCYEPSELDPDGRGIDRV